METMRRFEARERDNRKARKQPGGQSIPVLDRDRLADEVKQLIGQGANANEADESGRTVLMQAMFDKQDKLVELLLASGADVNARDASGETALMYAAYLSIPSIVTHLLEKGADPNAHAPGSGPVLFNFIVKPQPDEAKQGQAACIRALVQHGARLNQDGREGAAALNLAAMRGQSELVALMLELGADHGAVDRMGMTALMYASDSGSTETVKILLDQGANANVISPYMGTPLLRAIESRHMETALLLLEHSSKTVINTRGGSYGAHTPGDHTPLGASITRDMLGLVPLLLAKGANPDAPGNGQGEPPLHVAGQQRYVATVDALLDKGANIEAPNEDGETPLISVVAYASNPEMVELLLKRGANVGAKNRFGETVLELACRKTGRAADLIVLRLHGATGTCR